MNTVTRTHEVDLATCERLGEEARKLVDATLARDVPFLGVYGARNKLLELVPEACETLRRVAGYVYLDILQERLGTNRISCDLDGYVVR